ncbi:MAG: DNA repair exonuclease [Deinococcales bacterium]
MRVLCAADIHLGRRPSRLPEPLAGRAGELDPAAAWRRLVRVALDRGVDALLLAGDVVDQDNDFFEAYADLREGVEQLTEAGIPVLAVAGNHDVQVLPRLAEAVPGFTLLGRGGRWQEHVLEGSEGTRVRVLGWSFPDRVAPDDPLASPLPERGAETTIGLLHCDRGQPGSRYAPVRTAELEAAPVDVWLLGHVHKPDIEPGPRPMGYLGSLVGTDPGEPGAHGAWLLEVGPRGEPQLRAVPLAPLRWETLDVPLDGLADAADVPVRIAKAIDALHRRLDEEAPGALAIGCRLELTGRTALRGAVARTLAADDPRAAAYPRDGTTYFVHAYALQALPERDLEALARSADPVGLLARKLRLLRGHGDPAARTALLRAATQHLAEVPERRPLRAAGGAPPSEERVAELLEAAALDALDALLEQKEGAA